MTNEEPCTIRRAESADAPALLAMIHELARFEREPDAVEATVADLERDGWGPDPIFRALIAEVGGKPVGFALYFRNYSTWRGRGGLYVEDLWVAPEARGLGVGRRLLARIAAEAVAAGYRRIDLWVLGWNPARSFYDRLGFVDMEGWRPYRLTGAGLDALAREDAEPPGTAG